MGQHQTDVCSASVMYNQSPRITWLATSSQLICHSSCVKEMGFDRMNCWAKLFLRLFRHFDLKTLDDLYERVLARGWFPVNRSTEYIRSRGMTQSKQDKVMECAFAEYIGIEPPTDFSETQPKSPAMLINWRILRCIMQFGMTAEERRRVCKFDRPPKGSNFTIPRHR